MNLDQSFICSFLFTVDDHPFVFDAVHHDDHVTLFICDTRAEHYHDVFAAA